MQLIKIKIIKPLLVGELFFVQKTLELLYKETIDTFRLRLHNPKSLLEEIIQVIKLIEKKSLKEEYGIILFREALLLFKKEKEIEFNSIQKNYLLKSLADNNFKSIFYSASILISENKNYAGRLFGIIKDEIQRLNQLPDFDSAQYSELNRLISYFLIELKGLGFSKEYLHRFIRAIIALKVPLKDFDGVMTAIQNLLSRKKEKYTVYIGFNKESGKKILINNSELIPIDQTALSSEAANVNSIFVKFVDKHNTLDFYKIEVKAQDYYKAGEIAKQKIQRILDVLFMGHGDNMIELHGSCFIVGENEPQKGNRQLLNFSLDGFYRSNQGLYIKFLEKMKQLESKNIDQNSLSKIYSGLRYLRLGSISGELENKLLNYWIAIEYLFSSVEANEDKVKRLRNYFKKIHSISYAKRLYQFVHLSIANLKVEGKFSLYNKDDVGYLISPVTLKESESISSRYPLLHYRLMTLNDKLNNLKSIKLELERHQDNLESNLVRIYRIRNEIVHTAANEINIQEITSHLRYYLTFIINGFISFALNNPLDINQDDKISIDDYFHFMAIRLESILTDDNLTLEKLLKFENPIEYLS